MSLPEKPLTRRETYLAKAAGQSVTLPEEDLTREEQYLREIAEGGGGGGTQADWSQTDTDAPDYIKNKPTLGTAAAKDSTNAVTENSTDLVESGAVKTAIDTAVSSVYKPAGSKSADEFITDLLIEANLGKVYNASTSGTTTENFVEGAGKTINIGDNVVIVDVGTANEANYKFDLLAGFVDLSGKADKVSSATSGDLASLDASGNLTDSGSKAADFIISGSATGTAITLTDSADARVQGITIYGRSEVVEGEIKSVGDDGLTVTTANSDNTVTTSAEFTTALPLCSIPDTTIHDELNAGKEVVKQCGKVRLADLSPWVASSVANVFYAVVPNTLNPIAGGRPAITSKYIQSFSIVSEMENKTFIFDSSQQSPVKGVIHIKDTDYTTAEDFVASLGDAELVYELATPVTTPLTDIEISAFRQLRTYYSTTNINITDEPEFTIDYLKNTDNGEAISRVVDLLQGADIKAFTYTGTGTVNHSVTFPEVPTMVLAMFGQHTFSSNTWSVSSRPFVWGVRPVFVDWCAVGGTSNGNQMMPATYNGKEISFSGMVVSDPGAALNAEGETYTVYYI